MDYIDVVAAREYSAMVKITSEKIRAISPNVIILAGSDIDYLNEMYKSGINNSYTALDMHPYASPYPIGERYGREYGSDDCYCFHSTRASNFWCFKRGVERVRNYMIEQGDSAKPIGFTKFGFSSFNGWNGTGLQGQADHLERAIDIIRTQWPFVQVACFHEFIDNGLIKHREGYFGLLDKQLQIKPSGLVLKKSQKLF